MKCLDVRPVNLVRKGDRQEEWEATIDSAGQIRLRVITNSVP